jgi:hypothetical protein
MPLSEKGEILQKRGCQVLECMWLCISMRSLCIGNTSSTVQYYKTIDTNPYMSDIWFNGHLLYDLGTLSSNFCLLVIKLTEILLNSEN